MNKDLILLGCDYFITPKIKVKHPIVREVILLEEKYHEYCQQFLFKNEDFMVQLYDLGFKYYEIDEYEIFLKNYQTELYQNKFNIKNSLNFWLDGNYNFDIMQSKENKMMILYDKKNDIIIDILAYKKISEFIKLINNISTKNTYNHPGNDKLLKFLVRKEKEKQQRLQVKNKQQTYNGYLHDVINSVSWSNCGININNVWDLPIYQLYSGIRKIQQINDVKNLNIGVYTGNIDTKKNNINLDWINESKWFKENENQNIGILNM